ncbi:protein-disulfide reductase DsbD [Lutibaculum baratangense]|uniref:Cytochrome c-type biogenesis protein DsbD, protein-disulfide reductase n=1 Tax=Lutibaculum baratangense AMV1 TaxID=631454 RepID=V4R5N7_9HYPH|nr:protein-disulfide reductase DsbD [Lutibaculum baratangense]ESR27257.1 Cytochrome c-type biogenesis protein DsbD, protein-disulfide reductase [Lutibaculum baratangense AMV1]
MRLVPAVLIFLASLLPLQAAPLPADEAFALSASRDADGRLQLRWDIAEGYYLYREHFRVTGARTGEPVPFTATAGERKEDPTFGSVEVHYGEAVITLSETPAPPLEVSYQGCEEDGLCYRPETRRVDPETLTITAASGAGGAPSGWREGEAGSSASLTPSPAPASGDAGFVAALLAEGGQLWVIGSFLVFGILLAGTPCVFPMYPIVAAALGRQGERLTVSRGFSLSAVYVLFLALAFGLIGAVAGLTGENLQLVLQSSFMPGAVAAIFVVLALSMFGLFELRLPAAWTTSIAGATAARGGSYRGMAVLGFSSALIVGPCVTAPLAGALLYVAQTQDWRLGAAALFALGIGKGIPLVILSTFGSGILPKAGRWMETVSRLFGFAFLGSAIWLAAPLLPPGLDLALWSALLLGLASFALAASAAAGGMGFVIGRSLAASAGLYALILALGAASGGTDPLQPLAHVARAGDARGPDVAFGEIGGEAELQATLADGSAAGRSTLLYFTADWCVTCRTIERRVLPVEAVRTDLRPLRLLKVDLSEITPRKQALMEALGVVGPPTMVFLGPDLREVSGTRLVGTVSAESLSGSARRAGGA